MGKRYGVRSVESCASTLGRLCASASGCTSHRGGRPVFVSSAVQPAGRAPTGVESKLTLSAPSPKKLIANRTAVQRGAGIHAGKPAVMPAFFPPSVIAPLQRRPLVLIGLRFLIVASFVDRTGRSWIPAQPWPTGVLLIHLAPVVHGPQTRTDIIELRSVQHVFGFGFQILLNVVLRVLDTVIRHWMR